MLYVGLEFSKLNGEEEKNLETETERRNSDGSSFGFLTLNNTVFSSSLLSSPHHSFCFSALRSAFVRIGGLEPTRLAAPDPKSGSATNYDISAKIV